MSQVQNVNVIVSDYDSQDWGAPGSFQWLRPLATNAWADKAFAETELSSWSSKSQNLRDCPWFIRDLPKYRVRQKQWPSSPCVAHPRYRVIRSSRYLTNPGSHFHLLNVKIISTLRNMPHNRTNSKMLQYTSPHCSVPLWVVRTVKHNLIVRTVAIL